MPARCGPGRYPIAAGFGQLEPGQVSLSVVWFGCRQRHDVALAASQRSSSAPESEGAAVTYSARVCWRKLRMRPVLSAASAALCWWPQQCRAVPAAIPCESSSESCESSLQRCLASGQPAVLSCCRLPVPWPQLCRAVPAAAIPGQPGPRGRGRRSGAPGRAPARGDRLAGERGWPRRGPGPRLRHLRNETPGPPLECETRLARRWASGPMGRRKEAPRHATPRHATPRLAMPCLDEVGGT